MNASSFHQYGLKVLHKIAMTWLVIGALILGVLGLTKVNLLDKFLGKNSIASRAVCLLIGISAISLAFNRDTYLPFLGESVFPCSVLGNQTPPGATRTIQVRVQPDTKVIFWAAEPGDGRGTWEEAYRGYQISGVTTSDSSGVATLKVREPQGYTVPMRGYLEPHIHFRVCGEPKAFIGRIKTVNLAVGRIEGFQS